MYPIYPLQENKSITLKIQEINPTKSDLSPITNIFHCSKHWPIPKNKEKKSVQTSISNIVPHIHKLQVDHNKVTTARVNDN